MSRIKPRNIKYSYFLYIKKRQILIGRVFWGLQQETLFPLGPAEPHPLIKRTAHIENQ